MRISDWSSDVCSSDLVLRRQQRADRGIAVALMHDDAPVAGEIRAQGRRFHRLQLAAGDPVVVAQRVRQQPRRTGIGVVAVRLAAGLHRSEEHTSELQSLMRTSYAVFCLQKKKK